MQRNTANCPHCNHLITLTKGNCKCLNCGLEGTKLQLGCAKWRQQQRLEFQEKFKESASQGDTEAKRIISLIPGWLMNADTVELSCHCRHASTIFS